jgi:hypothetical protein
MPSATGQIPDFGPFQLIDRDTPHSAYTHTSLETGEEWELVFSDEFNNPGRTFWGGDDPYWEAADLHYWVTNNKEWYDPRMATTDDGALKVTLTNERQNGLNYTGGSESNLYFVYSELEKPESDLERFSHRVKERGDVDDVSQEVETGADA